MGNCIQSDYPQYQNTKIQNSKSLTKSSNKGLASRFEAIEGTLHLYRSILLRNTISIQKEIDFAVNRRLTSTASFALKRQKLYTIFMREIDSIREDLREATKNAEQNKNKKECISFLTATHTLVQDVGDLINLEDTLTGEDGLTKTQNGFEALFKKYEILDEEILELIEKMNNRFEGIELTQSTCLQRGQIPKFIQEAGTAILCESSC